MARIPWNATGRILFFAFQDHIQKIIITDHWFNSMFHVVFTGLILFNLVFGDKLSEISEVLHVIFSSLRVFVIMIMPLVFTKMHF